jgi:hypothetical protein
MRRNQIDSRLEKLQRELSETRELVRRLEVALVVRDPGNALSAQAYEGLRKTVVLSATERRSHASHLIQLLEAAQRGATLETMTHRIFDFLGEIGIHETSMDGPEEWYEDCDDTEMERPALVQESAEGLSQVWRPGRRVPAPVLAVEETSENEQVEEIDKNLEVQS